LILIGIGDEGIPEVTVITQEMSGAHHYHNGKKYTWIAAIPTHLRGPLGHILVGIDETLWKINQSRRNWEEITEYIADRIMG